VVVVVVLAVVCYSSVPVVIGVVVAHMYIQHLVVAL